MGKKYDPKNLLIKGQGLLNQRKKIKKKVNHSQKRKVNHNRKKLLLKE